MQWPLNASSDKGSRCYKLNPRISLQLQAGTNTAFDVLYSWAFD
ncbi:MAG: hypothetical protein ACJ8HI_19265 [Massilia sp.]